MSLNSISCDDNDVGPIFIYLIYLFTYLFIYFYLFIFLFFIYFFLGGRGWQNNNKYHWCLIMPIRFDGMVTKIGHLLSFLADP